MSVIAITVFVVGYALIASDRVNKTLVALGGAAIVVALGIVGSDEVFYSRHTGIDWDVIFLLFGMMVIVSVLRQTGVFEYIAIWSAKRAKAKPLRIMILLVLATATGSALLDNVTTVLLIGPVTLLVCDRLGVRAAPFLMAEVFASNIGGAATLVGDPPNIIIASRAGLTFNDFLVASRVPARPLAYAPRTSTPLRGRPTKPIPPSNRRFTVGRAGLEPATNGL
jgi:Na+/H+ antiporter NhaD/arsenite permease-like protein